MFFKMNIGDLKYELINLKDLGVKHLNTGWTYGSWRGNYNEISIEPSYQKEHIDSLIRKTNLAINNSFEGYKGGMFHMTYNTEVHVDLYGNYTNGDEAYRWAQFIDSNNSDMFDLNEKEIIIKTFERLREYYKI